MLNTPDSIFKNDYKMFNIRQLNTSIDSLTKLKDSTGKKVRVEANEQFHYRNQPDSNWNKAIPIKKSIKNFSDLIPDSAKFMVHNLSINVVNILKNTYQYAGVEWDNRRRDLRNNQIEWHRKFSLSLACLVLFFIGAPLGSIIRKGGLGMPLVAAIVLFLLFHLLNMFGEKFVKQNILSAAIGMWQAIIVLAPIGAFLTYKAMHDSQLFNKDFYNKLSRKIKSIFSKKLQKVSYE
jgi:lipopolysaccharide export system permease protein